MKSFFIYRQMAAQRLLPILLLVTLLAACVPGVGPAPTPTNVPAPTPEPSATATALPPTLTPTFTAAPTATALPTDTPTLAPTATSTSMPTATAPVSATADITATATLTDGLRPHVLDSTFNILLLGSDQRPGDHTWRTDTIIIAAVDWAHDRVGVINIPRDLWVDIPGYGESRINMADFVGEKEIKYPEGGPALLGRVISETLGIRTDRFARMNLQAFEQAIDTIGGVTVTLDCPLHEATPDPNNPDRLVEVDFEPGIYHFTGHEARMYASYRYYTGDWDRSRRQQQVLLAVRQQGLNLNLVSKIPSLWLTFKDAIQTNLSFKEIFDLATFGMRLDMKNVHGRVLDYRLVTPYLTKGGAQVLKAKPTEIAAAINAIFDTPPMQETAAQPIAGCKPTPTPKPSLTPLPSVTITATLTLTPTVTN